MKTTKKKRRAVPLEPPPQSPTPRGPDFQARLVLPDGKVIWRRLGLAGAPLSVSPREYDNNLAEQRYWAEWHKGERIVRAFHLKSKAVAAAAVANKKRGTAMREKVRKLIAQGKTMANIAKKLDLSPQHVRRLAKK